MRLRRTVGCAALSLALLAPAWAQDCSELEEMIPYVAPSGGADTVQRGFAQDAPLVTADALQFHQDVDERFVVYKTESEGVEDLQKLSRFGSNEEIWLFREESSSWFELGYFWNGVEYSGSFLEVVVDTQFLSDSLREGGTTKVVHHHVCDVEMPRGIFPSPNDIRNVILSSAFSYSVQPESSHSHMVVSCKGVVEFGLTDLGKRCFSKNWRVAPAYARSWQAQMKGDTVDELLDAANTQYISVEFTPKPFKGWPRFR